MIDINHEIFYNSADQAMMVVDYDGYILSSNNRLSKILGYSQGELINTKFWDYVHEEDKIFTSKESEEVNAGNQSESFINRYIHKNGSIIYFQWTSHTDIQNKMIYAIANNVTELYKKEHEIKEKNISLIQLKEAIDITSVISYTDISGNIIRVNSKFIDTYGYSLDEIIGYNHRLLSSGYHSKEFWSLMWDRIIKGEIWSGEICNRTKDGKLIWLYATIIPFKDSSGKILNFLEILNDITLSKEYEKELIETVNKRTYELNKSLDEKDFILHMVSHDLKNPLGGIILQTEIIKLLSQKYNLKEIEDKTKGIFTATNRMSLIIKNLLEFESIKENTNIPLEKVDILEIINELTVSFNDKLSKKNQLIFVYKDSQEYFSLSNKNYLYQIIENLVSNASKFSSFGSKIEIFIENKNNNVKILIKDYGPGISDKELEKLFDKFVKLSNKPTGDESSSGLGLAIVKKLCELLNHEIEVESKVNVGTIFTIILKSI